MTIHDILRFPRRLSEVLDDLHDAVATMRSVNKTSIERSLEPRRDSLIEELTTRVNELDSEAKKHAYQVASWKAEEDRWAEETEAYRSHVSELEARLLTTRDSLDCANNQIDELESQLKSRDSQPIPWRPVGEYDEDNCDACVIFMRGNAHSTVEFPGEDGAPRDATHFLYLDGPMPAEPEDK
jgi:uncharacterized coiled-coil DUF342 family protein